MAGYKLTKAEFKALAKLAASFIEKQLDELPLEDTQRQDLEKLLVLYEGSVSRGNTIATLEIIHRASIEIDKLSDDEKVKKIPQLGNKTWGEWIIWLIKVIDEHHQTRVDYVPNLIEVKARFKKIEGWSSEEGLRKKIFTQIYNQDKEAYDFFWEVDYFLREKEKLLGKKPSEIPSDNEINQMFEWMPYFLEDFTKTLCEAKEVVESVDSGKKFVPTKEEKEHEENILKQEITSLKEEKKELERKLAEAGLSASQKQTLQTKLGATEILLKSSEERSDELSKINTKIPNNKMNLGLILGISAVVITLICLVILLTRPRQRKGYY